MDGADLDSFSYNYWGSTDSATIRSKMFGKIGFMPFLLQPDSSCKQVPTSIRKENKPQQNATVYPNPAHTQFTIQLPAGQTISSVAVFNSFGTKVTTLYNSKDGAIEVNIAELPAGLYIYHIRFDDDRSQTGKLQKQ